jgi:hypothetical protein
MDAQYKTQFDLLPNLLHICCTANTKTVIKQTKLKFNGSNWGSGVGD